MTERSITIKIEHLYRTILPIVISLLTLVLTLLHSSKAYSVQNLKGSFLLCIQSFILIQFAFIELGFFPSFLYGEYLLIPLQISLSLDLRLLTMWNWELFIFIQIINMMWTSWKLFNNILWSLQNYSWQINLSGQSLTTAAKKLCSVSRH